MKGGKNDSIRVQEYYSNITKDEKHAGFQPANSTGICGSALFLDWIHDEISLGTRWNKFGENVKNAEDSLIENLLSEKNLQDKIKFIMVKGNKPPSISKRSPWENIDAEKAADFVGEIRQRGAGQPGVPAANIFATPFREPYFEGYKVLNPDGNTIKFDANRIITDASTDPAGAPGNLLPTDLYKIFNTSKTNGNINLIVDAFHLEGVKHFNNASNFLDSAGIGTTRTICYTHAPNTPLQQPWMSFRKEVSNVWRNAIQNVILYMLCDKIEPGVATPRKEYIFDVFDYFKGRGSVDYDEQRDATKATNIGYLAPPYKVGGVAAPGENSNDTNRPGDRAYTMIALLYLYIAFDEFSILNQANTSSYLLPVNPDPNILPPNAKGFFKDIGLGPSPAQAPVDTAIEQSANANLFAKLIDWDLTGNILDNNNNIVGKQVDYYQRGHSSWMNNTLTPGEGRAEEAKLKEHGWVEWNISQSQVASQAKKIEEELYTGSYWPFTAKPRGEAKKTDNMKISNCLKHIMANWMKLCHLISKNNEGNSVESNHFNNVDQIYLLLSDDTKKSLDGLAKVANGAVEDSENIQSPAPGEPPPGHKLLRDSFGSLFVMRKLGGQNNDDKYIILYIIMLLLKSLGDETHISLSKIIQTTSANNNIFACNNQSHWTQWEPIPHRNNFSTATERPYANTSIVLAEDRPLISRCLKSNVNFIAPVLEVFKVLPSWKIFMDNLKKNMLTEYNNWLGSLGGSTSTSNLVQEAQQDAKTREATLSLHKAFNMRIYVCYCHNALFSLENFKTTLLNMEEYLRANVAPQGSDSNNFTLQYITFGLQIIIAVRGILEASILIQKFCLHGLGEGEPVTLNTVALNPKIQFDALEQVVGQIQAAVGWDDKKKQDLAGAFTLGEDLKQNIKESFRKASTVTKDTPVDDLQSIYENLSNVYSAISENIEQTNLFKIYQFLQANEILTKKSLLIDENAQLLVNNATAAAAADTNVNSTSRTTEAVLGSLLGQDFVENGTSTWTTTQATLYELLSYLRFDIMITTHPPNRPPTHIYKIATASPPPLIYRPEAKFLGLQQKDASKLQTKDN